MYRKIITTLFCLSFTQRLLGVPSFEERDFTREGSQEREEASEALPPLDLEGDSAAQPRSPKKRSSKKRSQKEKQSQNKRIPKKAHIFFQDLKMFSDKGTSGASKTLRDISQGKPVLLVFWASWCSPCMSEFPSLQNLHQKYGDKITIAAVSIEPPVESQGFCIESITMPLYYLASGQNLLAQNNVTGIPAAFLLSAQGELLWQVSGARQWDSEDSISELNIKLSGALVQPPIANIQTKKVMKRKKRK